MFSLPVVAAGDCHMVNWIAGGLIELIRMRYSLEFAMDMDGLRFVGSLQFIN